MRILCFLCCLFMGLVATGQNLPLTPGQIKANYHAKAELVDGSTIRLKFRSPEWSAGVTVLPPAGERCWDFSQAKWLVADVENLSTTKQLRLTMHISSGTRKGSKDTSGLNHTNNTAVAVLKFSSCNTGIGLNPGEKRTMRIELPHSHIYRRGVGHSRRVLDTQFINSVEFQMQWPFEPVMDGLVDCRISNLRLEGAAPVAAAIPDKDYLPFVDKYGQYAHSQWPEKIRSDAELVAAHRRELAELQPAPAAWDEFGGWADGPKLKATGSFYTAKVDGKWYLVTPTGRLFWSLGVDVLRNYTDATNGSKHPDWFATPLPQDKILRYTHWNLQKKYGTEDYLSAFNKVLMARMRSWGLNTIGAWASIDVLEQREAPYTLMIAEFPKDFPRLGRVKFYDVFHPDFEKKMGNLLKDRAAENPILRKSINDPMCIGYFIDNELQFPRIMEGFLTSGKNCATRKEFARCMEEKYGSVEKLNKSWGTSCKSWEEAGAITKAPKGAGWRADATTLQDMIIQRYFQVCREAVKSVAPHRLYLGCRFVGFRQSAMAWKRCAEYCDVISVNAYTNSVANVNPKDMHDKPVLLGEFHFGTYDRGMFSPSLCPVGTQEERAVSFQRLVQGALVHPNFVGVHYFQFRDQPLTGRWDGEGYQIGFVDVCDLPYTTFTKAVREVGENMYRYRQAGKLVNSMAPAKKK